MIYDRTHDIAVRSTEIAADTSLERGARYALRIADAAVNRMITTMSTAMRRTIQGSMGSSKAAGLVSCT